MPTPLDLAYLTALAAASPWLAWRAVRTGRYRRDLAAKLLGRVPHLPPPAPGRPRLWFHGVSVGEVHLLRQLVGRARAERPHWDCVVSASTDTGLDEARRCFIDIPTFAWPLDFSWTVRRALAAVRPDLLVLAEGELWPGMLAEAERAGVPVAVVNGRFSPKSARRYRRLGPLARRLLNRVAHFAVQTDEYADHLRQLGVPADRVSVTGSVKYDGVSANPADPRVAEFRRLLAVAEGDLVWVAGSTQAPEEAAALAAFRRLRTDFPQLRLVLVPRQRDRFDEVAGLVRSSGLPLVRRSRLQHPIDDRDAVILVDTIGELSAVWGLADVAFVGGSLDGRRGGQNMIEPAAWGAAVLFGPHVWNFRDAARRLVEAGGAVQVSDAAGVEPAVRRLLADAGERARRGDAAGKLVRAQQGATARTLTVLDRLLAPVARATAG